MKVALLGLSHPHSGLLLTTLENLPEITRVFLWDSDPAVVAQPNLPASRKGTQPTSDLDAILALPDVVFAVVCVRHDQAAALAFRVVAAGKHLLAEKPVGLWLGCHCLDLLHHVSGDEITEVGAMLAIRSGESIDVEDCAVLTLKFRSGAVGTFHAGYTLAYSGQGYVNASGYDSYLAFNGRSGRIVWPDLEPRLLIESPPSSSLAPQRVESYVIPPSSSYGGTAGEEFFRRFIAATRGKGAPPTTLDDALRTARIIEAAANSATAGRMSSVVESLPAPGTLPRLFK